MYLFHQFVSVLISDNVHCTFFHTSVQRNKLCFETFIKIFYVLDSPGKLNRKKNYILKSPKSLKRMTLWLKI